MKAKCIDCGQVVEADEELCTRGVYTEVECFCPRGYDKDCENDPAPNTTSSTRKEE